ncbi:MAG: hypothetical protein LBI53_03865 [Candidatus Peribacteria bacterium]|nr:hypothetical protein [Candidatus Peribacteria bacterium]
MYGYLLEISVFKGVFSAMREMIEHHASSRKILQDLLKDQYIPFEQIIRFLRNVLTHTSTSRIAIQEEDFKKQKGFLLSKHIKNLHLNFIYSSYIPQWKGNRDYVCQIQLEISAIQPHVSLFDLISLHQMYLLTELCYNVSLLMTQRIKKVPSPRKQKSPLPPITKKWK